MGCRTVDSPVGKPAKAVHNTGLPVGRRWTTVNTSLWTKNDPQPVDIFCPLIPTLPTWTDDLSLGPPVDRIWTTPQSPSCGRHEPDESVENSPAQITIRTTDAGRSRENRGGRRSERGEKGSPEADSGPWEPSSGRTPPTTKPRPPPGDRRGRGRGEPGRRYGP